MFLNILIPALVILTIAMIAMALNILVKKNGKFPAYQIGHNKDMAKMGISCVKHDELKCHRARKKKEAVDCNGCQQLA